MRLKQISVFLENTPGHLEDVCKALAEAGVNLLTITIAETKEYGIVRAIVDKPDAAAAALKAAGFFAKLVDVLAVEVEDKPGALLQILKKTSEAGLNIECRSKTSTKRNNFCQNNVVRERDALYDKGNYASYFPRLRVHVFARDSVF